MDNPKKLLTIRDYVLWHDDCGEYNHPFFITDLDGYELVSFETEEEMADWIDAQIFTLGYTCAVQNLLASGNSYLAAMLIRESNMPEEDFRDAQERSGFMNAEMGIVFASVFKSNEED